MKKNIFGWLFLVVWIYTVVWFVSHLFGFFRGIFQVIMMDIMSVLFVTVLIGGNVYILGPYVVRVLKKKRRLS